MPAPATYLQRRRGQRIPAGAVLCNGQYRATGDARFANPLGIGHFYPAGPDPNGGGGGYLYTRIRTPRDAVEFYRKRLRAWKSTRDAALAELPGKVLMCTCPVGSPCHVQDVLIPLINEGKRP